MSNYPKSSGYSKLKKSGGWEFDTFAPAPSPVVVSQEKEKEEEESKMSTPTPTPVPLPQTTSAFAEASASTSTYISIGTTATSSDDETITDFDDLPIRENLLRGVLGYGFEKPSRIQQLAILPVFQGRDIIAQAQSGTGKTGAFGIGTLSRVNPDEKTLQAIILTPTRELAKQVATVLQGFSRVDKVKIGLGIGGISPLVQREELRDTQVLVGTPGRVYDILNRMLPASSSETCKMLVLDEADEMLSAGFLGQVQEIFTLLPVATLQVCLFSATMPPPIIDITKKFMRTPKHILVEKEELDLKGIRQFYIQMNENDKFPCLMDLYKSIAVSQCIIFANTKNRVDMIGTELRKKNFPIGIIHGDMNPEERIKMMDDFRTGRVRILLGTDLVARGIDVQQVSLVINYDIPRDLENYVHRIGRGGRFGRKGVAINFITSQTAPDLKVIQDHYRYEIQELPDDFEKYIRAT
jgi:translation initiation factor 4A